MRKISVSDRWVNQSAFLNGSNTKFVSVCVTGDVVIFDTTTNTQQQLHHHSANVCSVAVCSEDSVVVGDIDGNVVMLNIYTSTVVWSVKLDGPVYALAVVHGGYVFAGVTKGEAVLIDQRDGLVVQRLHKAEGTAMGLAVLRQSM